MTEKPTGPIAVDPTDKPDDGHEVNRFDITDTELAENDDAVREAMRSLFTVVTMLTNSVTPERLHGILQTNISPLTLAQLAASISSIQSVAAVALATRLRDEGSKLDVVASLNDLLDRAEALSLNVPPKVNA